MKNWLNALRSETLFSVWWILSALSTLCTFFLPRLSGKPRLVFAISTIIGFTWANFRVFQRQERRLSELDQQVRSHDLRVSELKITEDNGSRYILVPVADLRHGAFSGGFFEFHLMIENTGRRTSIVNTYHIEIMKLQQTFPNLRPEEGRHGVQGRHCQQSLYPPNILSTTGNIRIEAENATNHGTLLFFIPGINMEQFVEAGLRMEGGNRQFGVLRCRLTLTDTTQSSATHEFQLREE